MTVNELIDQLQGIAQDIEVFTLESGNVGHYYVPINAARVVDINDKEKHELEINNNTICVI